MPFQFVHSPDSSPCCIRGKCLASTKSLRDIDYPDGLRPTAADATHTNPRKQVRLNWDSLDPEISESSGYSGIVERLRQLRETMGRETREGDAHAVTDVVLKMSRTSTHEWAKKAVADTRSPSGKK